MIFSIENRTSGLTGAYAEAELRRILGELLAMYPESSGEVPSFVLSTDETMDAYSYRVCEEDGVVHLAGPTEAEMLLAVYLALERTGVLFDPSGLHIGREPDFRTLTGISETVRPFVRRRGIRQHINFPMDISAYRLEDAKEYIRSLARMRMNAITFHSYDGFYVGDAGHFFYGTVYPVPETLRDTFGGADYFVSPDAEQLVGDAPATGRFAKAFLRELMKTAHEAGLRVTLSIESNRDIAYVADVLNTYPDADELEMITPELGVFESSSLNYEEALNLARECFGDEVFALDGKIPGLDPEKPVPPRFEDTLRALADSIAMYRSRNEIFTRSREVPIRIGLYVLCRGSLYIAKRLMDRLLPDSVGRTYLPAHGTEAVILAAKSMEFDPKDFGSMTLYSWIEFDGNMYLAQNSAVAIGHTMDYLAEASGADSVDTVCFNHWRTSENRMSIAYAAAAMENRMSPECFFRRASTAFGLEDEHFTSAMLRAGALDTFCRDQLFNIGFCYLPCWTNHPGLGWCREWKIADVDRAISESLSLVKMLTDAVNEKTTADGRRLIALLADLYQASVCHLRYIRSLLPIRDAVGDKKDVLLSDAERNRISAALGEAQRHAGAYLEIYRRIAADRGMLGQIIDYYYNTSGYLRYLGAYYLGRKDLSPVIPCGDYAPPPPAAASAEEGNISR